MRSLFYVALLMAFAWIVDQRLNYGRFTDAIARDVSAQGDAVRHSVQRMLKW